MLGIQVLSALLNFLILILSPPQALRISLGGEWETQVTGDELNRQGTMGRKKEERRLLPTFPCAQIFIERERETSGYEADSRHCCLIGTLRADNGDVHENFVEI